ncbi:MAG: aminoacyl-tRNA hydrolase [Lachnospiraceae bacterium]|nr:aminoacyl-tRNA hydrolase [Lachnospiraceae bacterium]
MYMIAGLGNPGRQYENTRHNCGFETLDILMKEYGVTLTEDRCKAFYGKCSIEGIKCILVKPQTYMNLSGDAIRGLSDYYKIEPQNIIVICDDVNLAPGLIRVRPKGSAGGHNGLKDIIAKLGTDDFIRIRVGVGEKPQGWDLADHVLGHFSAEDAKLMEESKKNAVNAIKMIVGGESVDKVMSRFNTKQHTQPA